MMSTQLILWPMLAMVALTFTVGGVLLIRRIAYFKSAHLHPQKVATSAQMAQLVIDSRAADNFRNLFELPVLFHAAVITIYAAQLTSPLLVAMAWGYVVARIAHSTIHCTSNVVMQRFIAFLASCMLLAGTWLTIAYRLY